MSNTNKKELIWLPTQLVKKLKEVEDKTELQEKLVLKHIKDTKIDISLEIENLEEDVLTFKAAMFKYRKELKQVYKEENKKTEEMWKEFNNSTEKFYKKRESFKCSLEKINDDLNEEIELANKLFSKVEHINQYKLEKIMDFVEKFQSLDEETRSMFSKIIKK